MSGDGYLISVIIPVYNGADRISGAFRSVRDQTIGFDRLEVILVDDASTDGSGAMIDDIAMKHDNVVALHTGMNSGYAGRPRNVGMERATADYLMFLDQDDAYDPDACKLLYEAVTESGGDVVSGYYSRYDHDGRCMDEVAPTYRTFSAFSISTIDDRPEALRTHTGFWAKIYRKQLLEENHIRFIEDSPVEDMVFFAEVALHMSGYQYIEHPIVRYVVRNDGSDRSLSFDVNEGMMRAVGRGYDALYRVFAKRDRENYLKYILNGKANYYTKILLRGDYSNEDEALRCIRGLHGVYAGIAKYADKKPAYESERMTELVSRERYGEAVRFLLEARHFSGRMDRLRAKNRELKRKNLSLTKELRRVERSYGELQRRLKNSIIIRILSKIRGWRLF
jgi:glycosyltransferase involved in cell wall biosynthesis